MLVIFTGFTPSDYHFQHVEIFSNEYFSHADIIICLQLFFKQRRIYFMVNIHAKENIFKILKLIGKHALMNPGKFLKFCFFVSKIKMVVYLEFEIKFIPLLITFLLNKPFFTKKASFDDLFS